MDTGGWDKSWLVNVYKDNGNALVCQTINQFPGNINIVKYV